MTARVKDINLLPVSEFEQSVWGRFLRWAVTTGRYIIIVTEMVVILAFISRFKLDQDLADLAETIEGEKNVIEAQAKLEDEVRQTQTRIARAEQMLNGQLEATRTIEMIAAKVPAEVKLTELSISRSEISMQVTTASEKSLGLLLARIISEEKWKSVEVTNFAAESTTGIKVGLLIKT